MGAAYFIVLDRKIEGLETMMDGKALARAAVTLDDIARQLGVQPLSGFISVDPEQAADFLEGEGIGAGEVELSPLRQFPAQAGLTTVRSLLCRLEGRPAEIKDGDKVLRDLHDCERILSAAAEYGVKWHLEVDF